MICWIKLIETDRFAERIDQRIEDNKLNKSELYTLNTASQVGWKV